MVHAAFVPRGYQSLYLHTLQYFRCLVISDLQTPLVFCHKVPVPLPAPQILFLLCRDSLFRFPIVPLSVYGTIPYPVLSVYTRTRKAGRIVKKAIQNGRPRHCGASCIFGTCVRGGWRFSDDRIPYPHGFDFYSICFFTENNRNLLPLFARQVEYSFRRDKPICIDVGFAI